MTSEQDPEQVVVLQRIKPELTSNYIEAHEDVPESVIDAMVEGGVHEYRLYLRDEIAIGIIEVDDMDEFQERYESDPDNREWERFVEQFKSEGIEPEDMEMPVMEEIWSLSDEIEP